jgi:hypothetical protein
VSLKYGGRDRHCQVLKKIVLPISPRRNSFSGTDRRRPLKRAIQKEIETPRAQLTLKGEVKDGQKILVDYDAAAGRLSFTVRPVEEPVMRKVS